jgi:hypothetical protein
MKECCCITQIVYKVLGCYVFEINFKDIKLLSVMLVAQASARGFTFVTDV